MQHLSIVDVIDEQRLDLGFLSIEDVLSLRSSGNVVMDPFSTLIARSASIGKGNVFYPGVTIQSLGESPIVVGDRNIFHSSCFLLAEGGSITVGNGNQFGDGGLSMKANQPRSAITIQDKGRYLGGAMIVGRTLLGSGSQVIGAITVQDCELQPGEDFKSAVADARGAVLKGFGLARGIVLARGEVLSGNGTFVQTATQRQSYYHPDAGSSGSVAIRGEKS